MQEATAGPGREHRIFLAYGAVFVFVWWALPLLVGREPPNDNLEQLAWAETFRWGYAKHPPLPTWELIAAGLVFPKGLPLTYALGALQVTLLLAFAYRFARDTLGVERARTATLLITCILFYSHRLHFLNHNTLLLSAYAASVWLAYRAVATPGLHWWIALGAAWGIGMLSKYQMVVGIASSLVFVALSHERPVEERLRGLAAATVVSLLVFSPHAAWIVSDRFSTVTYAGSWVEASRPLTARILDVLQFAGEQLGRLAPALIAVALIAGIAARRRAPSPSPAAYPQVSALARRAIALHAWGPFAGMAGLSLAVGLDLGMPWGTAFLWAVPVWIAARCASAQWLTLDLARAMAAVAGIQLLLAAAFR